MSRKLPPLLSGKSQQNVLVLSGLITWGRRLQQLEIEKNPFDSIKFAFDFIDILYEILITDFAESTYNAFRYFSQSPHVFLYPGGAWSW